MNRSLFCIELAPVLPLCQTFKMSAATRVKRISRSEMMRMPRRKPKALIGCRHVQVFIMTLGFLSCYAVRVTMSVTLEAMTHASIANPNFEEFHWNNDQKNVILSSFFWGYICTQIPGSMIAASVGAQKMLSICLFVCGVATLSVPMAAKYGGYTAVCASRVIAGLCQGTILPTLHILLSKWAPTDERGTLATFVYSGGWIGNVISLLSSGLLSASSLGWPSCFYFWGGITAVIGIIAFFFGKESPSDHPNISLIEKEYIETSLGVTETKEQLPTPWIPMLKSVPVWALLITQCAQNWGFWMLLTKTPSYMADVLKYEISDNGKITSLPYFVAWVLSFPFSIITDLLIRRKVMSTGFSRKMCNTIGQWIPALALIGLGYVNRDQKTIAVAILVIAVGTNIAIYCGHNLTHIDLSPNFAGHLMGITNTAANICSIITPLISSVIVKDPADATQWRTIFFLSAGVYFLGNLAFILFGSSDIQKWNDPVKETRNDLMYQISEVSVSTPEKSEKIEKNDEDKIP
ncbi:putative inorganic phosphate cotransporter [Prorops nasuta]|uniref:putative inorganic phosphate cotransporter n=1 Tax=Prorops nasuta TaxID=863751 RepID=UPI0034CE51CA